MILVTNIEWDLDPCNPEATYEELRKKYKLPTEVKLNIDIDEDDHDRISDLLTDTYDWCILGFEYTIIRGTNYDS